MNDLRFFGPFPCPLQRSLTKVLNTLDPEDKIFWLYYESGNTIERVAALSAMLAELGRISNSGGKDQEQNFVIAALPGITQQSSAVGSEYLLDRLQFPYNLVALLSLPARSVDQLKDILKQETLHASAQYKSEYAQKKLHSSAVKPLWEQTLPPQQKGALLRYSALLVDDRVADKDRRSTGYKYCCEAAELLQKWGWEVWMAPTLQHAENRFFWQINHSNSGPFLRKTEKGKGVPLEHFEVVFLDIARPAAKKGKNDIISIEGIRQDLLTLSRVRSVLRFPQIYMLSHIPAEQIAHLCHALGADYYFEKDAFLRLSQKDFESILGHTIWLARGNCDMALRGKGEQSEFASPVLGAAGKKYGWENKWHYALVKHFFSRAHDITAVEFKKQHGGGYSGAMTIEVVPVKCEKGKQEEGKSEAEAESSVPKRQKARVIKIANLYELARELSMHACYVKPYVSTSFARIESQWAVNRGYGVIAYERAGGKKDSSVVMLEEEFKEESASYEGAMGLLSQICNALKPLHSGGREESYFRPMYDAWIFAREELLGSELGRQTESGNEDPQRMTILRTKNVSVSGKGPNRAVIGLDNCKKTADLRTWFITEQDMERVLGPEEMIRPGKRFHAVLDKKPEFLFHSATAAIEAELEKTGEYPSRTHQPRLEEAKNKIAERQLPQRMELWAENSFSARNACVAWGIIHGDFRLGNIMLEKDTGAIWIIDYGKTGEGPLALDYVQLAFDIRMRCIAPFIANELDGNKDTAEEWYSNVIQKIEKYEKTFIQPEQHDWKAQWINGLYERTGENFDVVEALFLLRVLQLYRAEPKTTDGLIALLWAAWLLDKRLAEAGFPPPDKVNSFF